jgi:RING finger/CHY zinc finger protein 1
MDGGSGEDEAKGDEGRCRHYARKCRLIAACCGRAVRCRFCHDEAAEDEMDDACLETMDRFAVSEVECDACGERQAVAEACLRCGTRFGAYACLACRFFDDDLERGYYHCDKCGICRKGGRENFVHCDKCGACLAPEHAPCVERKLDVNCPICFDRLFESTSAVSVLHCGHPIHAECLSEMMRNGAFPRCPTCCRTALPPGSESREGLWAQLRRTLAETPMPPEATRPVQAKCNDCVERAAFDAVWHATELYECPACLGFNVQRSS